MLQVECRSLLSSKSHAMHPEVAQKRQNTHVYTICPPSPSRRALAHAQQAETAVMLLPAYPRFQCFLPSRSVVAAAFLIVCSLPSSAGSLCRLLL